MSNIWCNRCHKLLATPWCPNCDMPNNRIKELETRIQQWEAQAKRADVALRDLEAENEQLRAALEEIAEGRFACADGECVAISTAQAALDDEPEDEDTIAALKEAIKDPPVRTLSDPDCAALAPKEELPTIEEMSGLVDDFTNGKSLKEYMDELRGPEGETE